MWMNRKAHPRGSYHCGGGEAWSRSGHGAAPQCALLLGTTRAAVVTRAGGQRPDGQVDFSSQELSSPMDVASRILQCARRQSRMECPTRLIRRHPYRSRNRRVVRERDMRDRAARDAGCVRVGPERHRVQPRKERLGVMRARRSWTGQQGTQVKGTTIEPRKPMQEWQCRGRSNPVMGLGGHSNPEGVGLCPSRPALPATAILTRRSGSAANPGRRMSLDGVIADRPSNGGNSGSAACFM